MAKTIKKDWLNEFLASEGALMSGHPILSKQLGVSNGVSCCFRFIYDYRTNRIVYLLTIETTDQREIDLFFRNNAIQALRPYYGIFGSDLMILFYSAKVFFLYDQEANSVNSLSSSELQSQVSKLNPNLIIDPGTSKGINKTINDSFQIWTRSNLTRKCVVNDIDGIYREEGGRIRFLELKRVDEDLNVWRPYLDDLPNYRALQEIANQLNGKMLVYAYQSKDDQLLAMHYDLITNSRSQIEGRYFLCNPKFLSPSKLGEGYVSKNRRVPG